MLFNFKKTMNSVTLQFINSLREAQNKLYKEDSMNDVESVCVKSQTDQIVSLFNQSRINQKEYFKLINQIVSPNYFSDSLSSITSDLDPNQIKTLKIPSKSIIDILRFVLAFQDLHPIKTDKRKFEDQKKFFVDLLTFSFIPSHFNFFWTEYSIKNLYKFFSCVRNHRKDEFYDSLARIGFCTPFFLRFSELCFQSVFSELSTPTLNFRAISKESIIKKIRCNVKKFQNFIPDETLVVLSCSSNPYRTLTNSFFSVALSSPIAAQTFRFFHFSCKPTREALIFLKSMFDFRQQDSYIRGFLDAIMNCGSQGNSRIKDLVKAYNSAFKDLKTFDEKEDEKQELKDFESKSTQSKEVRTSRMTPKASYFELPEDETSTKRSSSRTLHGSGDMNNRKEELFEEIQPIQNKINLFSIYDIYYAHEILQVKFLSSLDVELIKFLSGKSPEFNLPKKIKYFYDSETTCSKLSKVTVDESTVLNRAYLIAPMIRHLLKKSDMIPHFQKAPPNMNCHDFLYSFLVRRGDISYLPERTNNFNKIMAFFQGNSINTNTILEALSCTTFSRTKKIQALSTLSLIEQKIDYLDTYSQKEISQVKMVKDINDKIFTQFRPIRQAIEYIRMPSLFVTDYNASLSKFYEIPEFSLIKYQQKMVFAVLSSKIDLNTFALSREKLRKFPVQLKEYDDKFSKNANSCLFRFVTEYFSRKSKGQPNQSPSSFDKNSFIANKIMSVVVEKRDIVNTMVEAFIEPSLMRKVDLISLALTNFQMFLEYNYPPNRGKLGSDEFTPAFAALIILCNPPLMITNYAYLHDFTTGELPITEILGGYVSTIPIYLSIAAEYVIPELINKPPFLLVEEDI